MSGQSLGFFFNRDTMGSAYDTVMKPTGSPPDQPAAPAAPAPQAIGDAVPVTPPAAAPAAPAPASSPTLLTTPRDDTSAIAKKRLLGS